MNDNHNHNKFAQRKQQIIQILDLGSNQEQDNFQHKKQQLQTITQQQIIKNKLNKLKRNYNQSQIQQQKKQQQHNSNKNVYNNIRKIVKKDVVEQQKSNNIFQSQVSQIITLEDQEYSEVFYQVNRKQKQQQQTKRKITHKDNQDDQDDLCIINISEYQKNRKIKQKVNNKQKIKENQVKQNKKDKKEKKEKKQQQIQQNNSNLNSQTNPVRSLIPPTILHPPSSYLPNIYYPIPLKINTTNPMINCVSWKYQGQQNNELCVSRYKGDKWQIVPAFFDFTIPPHGKYTLKMQVLRSRSFNIWFGITCKAAQTPQWQRAVPTPNLCFLMNKCAFSQRPDPRDTMENQIFTKLKKIYEKIEMQVDMDRGQLVYYMKWEKRKKFQYKICDYLMNQARLGEKQRLQKEEENQRERIQRWQYQNITINNSQQNKPLQTQLQTHTPTYSYNPKQRKNTPNLSSSIFLSSSHISQNSRSNSKDSSTNNIIRVKTQDLIKKQIQHGLVPFIGFRYDYDQVRFSY